MTGRVEEKGERGTGYQEGAGPGAAERLRLAAHKVELQHAAVFGAAGVLLQHIVETKCVAQIHRALRGHCAHQDHPKQLSLHITQVAPNYMNATLHFDRWELVREIKLTKCLKLETGGTT
jgi:hypothetical protein